MTVAAVTREVSAIEIFDRSKYNFVVQHREGPKWKQSRYARIMNYDEALAWAAECDSNGLSSRVAIYK